MIKSDIFESDIYETVVGISIRVERDTFMAVADAAYHQAHIGVWMAVSRAVFREVFEPLYEADHAIVEEAQRD